MSFLTKIFGDYSTKEVKRIRPLCDRVLALDEEFSKLTDSELQAKTPEFKQRLLAPSRATAFTSSRSMIILPAATANGWARSIASWV